MTSAPDSARLRRPRRAAVVAAAVIAGAATLLAACSAPAPTEADLTSALVDSGLPKPVAQCTSKALVGSLSTSELQELAERGAGGAPVDDPARKNDSADKLSKAMLACREELVATQPATTTTPSETPGTTAPTPGDTAPTVPTTGGAELNTTAAP